MHQMITHLGFQMLQMIVHLTFNKLWETIWFVRPMGFPILKAPSDSVSRLQADHLPAKSTLGGKSFEHFETQLEELGHAFHGYTVI